MAMLTAVLVRVVRMRPMVITLLGLPGDGCGSPRTKEVPVWTTMRMRVHVAAVPMNHARYGFAHSEDTMAIALEEGPPLPRLRRDRSGRYS
jgi:hypothetical protein